MKIIDIVLVVACAVVIGKACNMAYASDVVDSIPADIRERMIMADPGCTDMYRMAKVWNEKRDSILAEVEYEQWWMEEYGHEE